MFFILLVVTNTCRAQPCMCKSRKATPVFPSRWPENPTGCAVMVVEAPALKAGVSIGRRSSSPPVPDRMAGAWTVFSITQRRDTARPRSYSPVGEVPSCRCWHSGERGTLRRAWQWPAPLQPPRDGDAPAQPQSVGPRPVLGRATHPRPRARRESSPAEGRPPLWSSGPGRQWPPAAPSDPSCSRRGACQHLSVQCQATASVPARWSGEVSEAVARIARPRSVPRR